MLRGSIPWVCRASLVAVLLGAAASAPLHPQAQAQAQARAQAQVPGPRASDSQTSGTQASAAQRCGATSCYGPGTIRWRQPLTGAYVVHNDSRGTVPASGEPYAAISATIAAYGLGTQVTAYDSRLGTPRWKIQLESLPRGAKIVSIRAWAGVVTVGVAVPARRHPARQTEVVLDATTGRVLRSYPRIAFGGAVAADSRRTVVVGPGAVTCYDNRTGRIAWKRRTGAAPQRWQLDGHWLYVAVAAGGYLAPRPVTALRKIDLRSGAERLVRPRSHAFTGTLSGALDGVVLFSGPSGVTAYGGSSGRRLWQLKGAVPQGADLPQHRFYLTRGSVLLGVGPRGDVRSLLPGSVGLYAERDGVAFGLDQGEGGDAWGVDVGSKQVTWSTPSTPWPHVFVDLSGLGGTADPRSDAIILAACGQVGSSGSPPPCRKPELVVINR